MAATRGTREEQKHPQMTASIVAGPLSLYDGREGGRTRSNNVGMELIIGVCCSLPLATETAANWGIRP